MTKLKHLLLHRVVAGCKLAITSVSRLSKAFKSENTEKAGN